MSSQPFHGVAYERLPREDIDEGGVDSDITSGDATNNEFPDRQHIERRLLRKLDLRMSILVLIFILNFIDRSNVAAARLRGFEDDLQLEGQQFNTILSVLHVGYTLMQVPSNMFLDQVGKPSIYLPTSMAIWGLITVLMGTTKGFIGAMCTRFFLGFFEAAFFPGALLLLSKWYKRRELGQRTAILSCGLTIGNAFGSLIASGVLDAMDGVMGKAAWRWLFFIEGCVTVFVAICSMFILPDFPAASSYWLTPEEQALAQLRMKEDFGGGTEEELEHIENEKSDLKQALTDWKVWWLALTLTCLKVLLAFTDFFPTISATLGYTPTVSLLLCIPPWVFATCTGLLMSRHSDRVGERFGHIVISLLVGMSGFLVAMTTMNVTVRYITMFLMAQTWATLVILFAWISNSTTGLGSSSKGAIALGFINAFSTLGVIAGSYVWQKSWGPSYYISCAICIGAGAVCIIMLWIFRRHLMQLNQEMEAKIHTGRPNGFKYML